MYFSNGTENDMFVEKHCVNCEHYQEDKDFWTCPILDAHFYNSNDKKGLKLLNLIISDKTEKCKMFMPIKRDIRAVKELAIKEYLKKNKEVEK